MPASISARILGSVERTCRAGESCAAIISPRIIAASIARLLTRFRRTRRDDAIQDRFRSRA
jgi:hypothetical protein